MATNRESSSNMLGELHAQDEVASMMEDNEVMDQLEEIGRTQRGEDKVEVPKQKPKRTESDAEVLMGTPAVGNDLE